MVYWFSVLRVFVCVLVWLLQDFCEKRYHPVHTETTRCLLEVLLQGVYSKRYWRKMNPISKTSSIYKMNVTMSKKESQI